MSTRSDPPRDGEGDRRAKAGGGGGSEPRAPSLRRPAVYAARRLRRKMSLPEILLWQRLRGSPQGIAFRKQHAIDPYVADFYCAGPKLVIEIDGVVHNMGDRPHRDGARNEFLQSKGYRLLRIPAEDILKDPDSVAESIIAYAADPLHHRAARGGPPPSAGRPVPRTGLGLLGAIQPADPGEDLG